MKVKKVYRYYCDHCKRNKGTRESMRIHEERCLKNPDRWCPVCEDLGGHKSVIDYIEKHGIPNWQDDAEIENSRNAILDLVDDCPACALAGMVQTGCNSFDFQFDYESAINKYLKQKREDQYDGVAY